MIEYSAEHGFSILPESMMLMMAYGDTYHIRKLYNYFIR